MEYEIEDDPQGDAERIDGDRDGGLEDDDTTDVNPKRRKPRPAPRQPGEKENDNQLS